MTMNEEQAIRIMWGAAIIAALPYLKIIICRLLGDDYEGGRSWRYALGKTVGRAVGDLRNLLWRKAK